MTALWAEGLVQLQHEGTITGFVLITARGPAQPATGRFADECAPEGELTPQLRQLVQTFKDAEEPPTSYQLWGSTLVVVHSSDGAYVAVAKQRQLGLVAVNLPAGVLLASFDRRALPAAALTAVQRSCAAAFGGMPVGS